MNNKILGCEDKFNRLKGMILNNTLPHAMLFTGVEGIGKRQVAIELSRIILCHENGANDCDCPSCHAFFAENHPDYFTLVPTVRGKSSPLIRIDDVGELINDLSRLPILSQSRVAVIDDADLMNDAAANRLLKTIEEPIGDIKFFLIAKRRSAILPTILSRTMPVAFSALSAQNIVLLLTERGVEESVAKDAARLSFGSMKRAVELVENDGLKIIDEVMSFLKGNINYKNIFTIAEELGKEDRSKLYEFISALMLILRDTLMYYEGMGEVLGGKYGKSLVNLYDKRRIFKLLALAQEYEKRLASNANSRLLMEGFLLKYRRILGEV